MTNAEIKAREKEMNKKFEDRRIEIDDTNHTLQEFNEIFGGDCSSVEIYIGGSQGVSSYYEDIYYGKDFTSLKDISNFFFEALSNNALDNIDSYLDDQLDGLDPDELDEDELNELKGEAQAEAECDSGERYIVVKTTDGGALYYEITPEDLIFSHCYYY